MVPFGAQKSRGRGGRGGGEGRGGGGGRGGRGGRGGHTGRRGPGGPKLPSELLERVDATYGSTRCRVQGSLTRKDTRKAARQENRVGRTRGRYDDDTSDAEEDDEDPALTRDVRPKLSEKAKGKRPVTEESEKPKKKRKLPELTLPGMKEDDAEDGEIEWLEYMLKKEKKKAKEEDALDDGLDNLLDFADIIGPGGSGLQPGGEPDEDGFGLDAYDSEEDSGSESEDEDDDEGDEGSDQEIESESEQAESSGEEEDETGITGDQDEEEEWHGVTSSPARSSTPAVEPVPESAPTKYIPPALRAAQLAKKASGDTAKIEEKRKLERKLQGLLNKLSEANIENILREIEDVYRNHSRNDVTTSMTTLILRMISNKANLLDSFVILYATLVGALHRIIGLEFGAHSVHTLVTRYHKLANDPSTQAAPIEATIYETPDASKEALNLLTLIAELFNAGTVSSGLIYDLVRGFLASGDDVEVLSEAGVESLLKVLRCCGPQLRSDDPASLKDIVGLVQDKTKGKEKTMTTRARFMVETLTNIKNGKQKSLPGDRPGEAAERMKEFLSGLGRKRRLLASEPLRVSLADLLSADKKGKWWLVGAGWAGNPLVEHEQARLQAKHAQSKTTQEASVKDEQVLLDLARKQGMNTDIRRTVFVIMMTSEDFMHACDRLSHLKFSDVQQREFIRVALHCCGLEKRYNPYYTLILNNLCSESYDHRFTLQYALWDFLKEIGGEANKDARKRGTNIAKAMAYVIARGSLDLTVFKAVEWTELNTATTTFLATFLVYLVIATQTLSPLFALPKSYDEAKIDIDVIEETFEKALSNSELSQGWAVLIRTELSKRLEKVFSTLEIGDIERTIVKRGLEVARGILARAV